MKYVLASHGGKIDLTSFLACKRSSRMVSQCPPLETVYMGICRGLFVPEHDAPFLGGSYWWSRCGEVGLTELSRGPDFSCSRC